MCWSVQVLWAQQGEEDASLPVKMVQFGEGGRRGRSMGQGAGAGRVLVSAGTWAELAPCCFGSVKCSFSWNGDTLFSIVFVHGDLTQFSFRSYLCLKTFLAVTIW